MMKKFKFMSLIFVCILFLAACGTSEDASTEEDGNTDADPESTDSGDVYSVGIIDTYPPFVYQEAGEHKGIDIDVISAIAENQGFEIEFEALVFSGLIPAIQAGQLDLTIAGMSITDERKEVVDFSDSYYEAGNTLVVAEDNDTISSVEDLEGHSVVVKTGTTSANWAEEHQDEYGFDIIQASDSPSMFQEIANGTADALIEDYPVIAYAIATDDLTLKIVGDLLNEEGDFYGIALLKGENDELLQKLNDGLANIKENGKYDEIIKTYLD